ncbi:histone-lysine N-methyltransferase SMYD3-like [Tetranychus urticae]|uniref:Protein-lysine N-methyltransferase SMYD4 n=1 Tax=Tetranychus urticae TaxID=32264 RepID=T1K271_TETUR|nr:histone-lysine N-methyltransferase SMYD3-like [Tetranychus urticae]
MTKNKSLWNKIFAIKESLESQIKNENSPNSVQLLAEWYTFSTWIYTIYRKSFATRDDRKAFEAKFADCSTNAERVNCLMACQPIQAKFLKYANKLWSQTDVPAKEPLHAVRKYYKNKVKDQKDGWKNTFYDMPDPFEDMERLMDESDNLVEVHVKSVPMFEGYVENPSLKGVSSSVSLGNHEIKRRQLLANSDIPIGKVIAREGALCGWLSPIMYSMYCYRCLLMLDNQRITCQGCKTVNYCSLECYKLAKKEFHGKECDYMEMLKHISICHFTIRLLLVLEPHRVAAVSADRFKDDFPLNFNLNENGDSFGNFLNLESGTSGVSQADLLTFSCTSLFTSHLLREMSFFDRNLPEKPLVCSLISMMILISRNIFTLYDHKFRLLQVPDSPDALVEGKTKEIGYGLFYKTSLFNHSCRPNAHAVFFGSSILVVATKPIPAKTEITISYGASYPDMKLKDRQEKLRNSFYFNCLCEQCEAELNEQSKAVVCDECALTSAGDSTSNIEECIKCQDLKKIKKVNDKIRSNGLSFYNKGRKLLAAEDYLKAAQYLSKAVKYLTESNDPWHTYNARDDLVVCYRSLEYNDQAFANAVENLKLRARLYDSDSVPYLNSLLVTLQLAHDCQKVDVKEIEKIIKQFYRLFKNICARQTRIFDYSNQHFLEFLTHKSEYIESMNELINNQRSELASQ